jgi:hypothetical protein
MSGCDAPSCLAQNIIVWPMKFILRGLPSNITRISNCIFLATNKSKSKQCWLVLRAYLPDTKLWNTRKLFSSSFSNFHGKLYLHLSKGQDLYTETIRIGHMTIQPIHSIVAT